MSTTDSAVLAVADRLEFAGVTGVACSPVVDLIGGTDVAIAYRVQQILTERRIAGGARIVGRKIGLTSAAVQSQIGVDRPDFGVLFDDMRYANGDLVPFGRLLQPRAEAELAFVLGRDITDTSSPADVRAAVDVACPALEIVDSRISDWKIGITDTVADNASSGVFVVGDRGFSLDDFDSVAVAMTMRKNGEVVSTGSGRDCLGDPLNALTWLAATAIEFGSPLRAGDVVLSGALGPMVTVDPGDTFEATIDPLGSITVRFSTRS